MYACGTCGALPRLLLQNGASQIKFGGRNHRQSQLGAVPLVLATEFVISSNALRIHTYPLSQRKSQCAWPHTRFFIRAALSKQQHSFSDPSPGSFAKVFVAEGGAVYKTKPKRSLCGRTIYQSAAAATQRHSDSRLEDDDIAAVHHLNRALRASKQKRKRKSDQNARGVRIYRAE